MSKRTGARQLLLAELQRGGWWSHAQLHKQLPMLDKRAISNGLRHMREDCLLDVDASDGYRRLRYRLHGSEHYAPAAFAPPEDGCLLARCWTVAAVAAEVRDGMDCHE